MNSATKREALLVFLLLAYSYMYFYHDPGWNGNDRLGLTFAIVQEGRLTIDSFHDQPGTDTRDKAFYNGHYYSSKAIGSSLIAVFFYYPLYHLEQLLHVELDWGQTKYLLTFLAIGLPSALAGSLMYVLCKQVTSNKIQAYVATLAITLGTMIFPFSVIFFGHQLAGTLLFSAFFLIYQLKVNAQFRRNGVFFLVGLLLGFALITEYPVAFIVLILTIYYLIIVLTKGVENRSLALTLPALAGFVPIAVVLAYNIAIFGNPLSTGYSFPVGATFQQEQSQGLVGISWPNPAAMFYMTVHPAFGLFWQSPVLILSFVGIIFMLRDPNYRIEALIAVTAFLSLLLIYSGFPFWWGGRNFGPRYLIPMLVFLCLPLVFIPKRWLLSAIILGLIAIAQMFIAVSSLIIIPDDFIKHIERVGFFAYSSIYSFCLQLLLAGDFATNLGNKFFGLNAWIGLIPVVVVMAVITLVFCVMKDDSDSIPSLR